MLGLPGHATSNPAAARDALGELLATPEMLRPAELAFAYVMLHEVNARIAQAGENQRAAVDSERDENVRIEALNRRIQAQTVENARLRQELTEALKKLEAVATLDGEAQARGLGIEIECNQRLARSAAGRRRLTSGLISALLALVAR